MTYSAVIHPPARSSGNQGGSSCEIEAVHQTTVFPCCHSTDPPGICVKFRVIVTGRNWSGALLTFCIPPTIPAHGRGEVAHVSSRRACKPRTTSFPGTRARAIAHENRPSPFWLLATGYCLPPNDCTDPSSDSIAYRRTIRCISFTPSVLDRISSA